MSESTTEHPGPSDADNEGDRVGRSRGEDNRRDIDLQDRTTRVHAALEGLRQFVEEAGASVAFLDSTGDPGPLEELRGAFPDLVVRDHLGPGAEPGRWTQSKFGWEVRAEGEGPHR